MEEIITSPLQQLQQWIGRSSQRRNPDEEACRWKQVKTSKCKHNDLAPVASFAEKHAAKRAPWLAHHRTAQLWMSKAQFEDALVHNLAIPAVVVSIEARFRKLADEWSEKTIHISSVSDLINDTRYQQIIDLGWDVLPYMLDDLQKKKRFWFPALAAIAGVRPFDPGDLSNPRRMTEAWLKWGRRKGLID